MIAALLLAAAVSGEPIGFTMNSWGKPLVRWTMAGDGSIEFVEAANRPGGDFRRYDEENRRTSPDLARRRWLEQVLTPVRKRAGRPPECGDRLTDLPYGEIRWGPAPAPIALGYDSGCRGADAVRVLARLRQANDQVAVWAHKATVIARRSVTLD